MTTRREAMRDGGVVAMWCDVVGYARSEVSVRVSEGDEGERAASGREVRGRARPLERANARTGGAKPTASRRPDPLCLNRRSSKITCIKPAVSMGKVHGHGCVWRKTLWYILCSTTCHARVMIDMKAAQHVHGIRNFHAWSTADERAHAEPLQDCTPHSGQSQQHQ